MEIKQAIRCIIVLSLCAVCIADSCSDSRKNISKFHVVNLLTTQANLFAYERQPVYVTGYNFEVHNFTLPHWMKFPAEASDVATIGSKFEETFKSKNYEQMKQLFTDDVWSLHSNMSRTETNDGTNLFSVGVSETV